MARIFPRSAAQKRAASLAAFALLTAVPAQTSAAPSGFSAPSIDSFYTPQNPLPPGVPGDVIRQRNVNVHADPSTLFPLTADAWQIMYPSTTATGRGYGCAGTAG
jgi:hypothetical protein